MTPTPDHGEDGYRGSGRLTGKKATAIVFAREGADVVISRRCCSA